MNLLMIRPESQLRDFLDSPGEVEEIFQRMKEFYLKVGFEEPWVGYFAQVDEEIVGSCGFKGGLKDGKLEIAYVTFERYRSKGHATAMCKSLVEMYNHARVDAELTARTLPEKNYSTRVLEKNGFRKSGIIEDHDGEMVWEWIYSLKNFNG